MIPADTAADSSFFARLRYLALAVVLGAVVLAALGLDGLRFNAHYSAYFDGADPRLVRHGLIAETFGRRDTVLVILAAESGTLLDRQHYLALEDLTGDLSHLPFATAAISIASLGILGERTFADGSMAPSLEQLRDHDRVFGLLLSEDTRYALLRVEFDLPDTTAASVRSAAQSVRETVAARIGQLPLQAHLSGTLALNEAYIGVVRRDLAAILPLLLVAVVVLLSWLFGSVKAMMTVLPVGLLAIASSFGFAGLLGAELAAINAFVPVILLSISLAGCVHMSLEYQRRRRAGDRPRKAAREAIRINLLPMSLANATTAVGFLGLLFSPSPPVRVVGYIVAAGIVMSFILCMSLLPILQVVLDPVAAPVTERNYAVDRFYGFVSRRRKTFLLGFACLALPAAWFAAENSVSDNVFDYFSESHRFHRDTRLLDQHFSGINEVLLSADFGETDALFRAGAVEAVDRLAGWLRGQSGVRRVTSLGDHASILEARREGRLQERLDRYRTMSREHADISSLVFRDVSRDFSSTLLAVYLEEMDSAALVSFDRRVDEWARENIAGIELTSGGAALMFAYLGEDNIRGMAAAFLVAMLGAAIVSGIVLRSARISLVGMVCNILPVILVFSVWSIVDGRISIGAAIVLGMILGIVVDDTIYLLAAFRRRLAAGDPDPVAKAVSSVGPALVVTSVVLVIGIGTGMLSAFGPIWSMSVLTVSIIAAALITDLSLLPAMLLSSAEDRHD